MKSLIKPGAFELTKYKMISTMTGAFRVKYIVFRHVFSIAGERKFGLGYWFMEHDMTLNMYFCVLARVRKSSQTRVTTYFPTKIRLTHTTTLRFPEKVILSWLKQCS